MSYKSSKILRLAIGSQICSLTFFIVDLL
jgi:hypothetical protein